MRTEDKIKRVEEIKQHLLEAQDLGHVMYPITPGDVLVTCDLLDAQLRIWRQQVEFREIAKKRRAANKEFMENLARTEAWLVQKEVR